MSTIPSTVRSTKAELLAAFEEMKANYEELKKQQPNQAQIFTHKKEEEKILTKTEGYSPESIENEITGLRRKIQTTLDSLLVELADESTKLSDVRLAITIENERLAETRQIQLAADTLEVLLAEYDQKQKELDSNHQLTLEKLSQEVVHKKKEWEREEE